MSHGLKQFTWGKSEDGDFSRPLQLCRPCPCGCDFRDGQHGVGYLTGGDKDNSGITLWIDTEEVYQELSKVLKAHNGKCLIRTSD